MAYSIETIDIWSCAIQDRPGGLAERLTPLADAGAKLEFVLARRNRPRKGLLFVAPIKGAAQARAAKMAGLAKDDAITALRVEGPDKVGVGAAMTAALAEADISLRGFSAAAIARKCVCYIAFDTAQDAAKSRRILAKVLRKL